MMAVGRPKALPCSQMSLSISDSEAKTLLTWIQQAKGVCLIGSERERERESASVCVCVDEWVGVCVCEWMSGWVCAGLCSANIWSLD